MSEIALSKTVDALLGHWPDEGGDITTQPPRHYDMRSKESYAPFGIDPVARTINDARAVQDTPDLGRHGFATYEQPSAVKNWFDVEQVMDIYYQECKDLARKITGASVCYTFDHLIREPGKQTSGGGTDRSTRVTGSDQGGGYVGTVHMDYTTNTTWDEYLSLHHTSLPANPERTIALNFWRPISSVVDDNPLAVCDARTVRPEDLFETVVRGYGADNYSWHNIGIETYNVKASDRHAWYYYPLMTNREVLIFKSYDSEAVIGNTCPHASFTNPDASPDSPARKSIELRVLCFVTN